MAKLYGHLMVATYRERYGMHASSGILYNHESPRRPAEFVTRKVTRTAAAIKLGLADELRVGDLDATRDWSYAGDVVDAMRLMLQQPRATTTSSAAACRARCASSCETAFAAAEIDDFERYVVVDPEFVRPPDPVALVGDPSKAREKLGWVAQTSFEEMIAMMVREDLRVLSAERQRGAVER